MSAVSVLVIDCTTMGAPPPTRTGPMRTCTEERRSMLMNVVKSVGFLGILPLPGVGGTRAGCYDPRRPKQSVRRESGSRRNAEGAIPPGNAQAHERQTAVLTTAGLLESGGTLKCSGPPTEGERRLRA